MNKVIELLKQHRSIRRYTNQPISEELLHSLIEAGQMASTSSFIQAVSVVRITGDQARADFAELSGNQPYIESASEFLVFCADLSRNQMRAEAVADEELDYAWAEQFISATVDVGLFAQNVVIAAESEGLGCCYIGGIRNDPDRVTQLLSLPKLVYPVFGLCVGFPDQNPDPKPRMPVEAMLHQGRYHKAREHQSVLDDYDTFVKQYYTQRTKGKLETTWSELMARQAISQKRPFMKKYIKKQGFMIK